MKRGNNTYIYRRCAAYEQAASIPVEAVYYFVLILLAFIIFIMTTVFPDRLHAEEDPTISLVKTIEVREFEGLKFTTDDYVVKEGDSIAKILFRRGIIGKEDIPEKILRLILAVNKDLKNPDLILPGQKLVLPKDPIEGVSPAPAEKTSKGDGTSETAEQGTSDDGDLKSLDGVKYQVVQVKRGDRLATLLRRAGVPDHLIFNEAINVTLKINPQLSDPDLIFAGEAIKIPVQAAWAETGSDKPIRTAKRKTGDSGVSQSATKVKPRKTARVKEEKAPKTIIPPPQLPPSKHLGVRTALGLIYTRIGERYISKGQHFIPLKTGGQININTQSFPIIEFTEGRRIILDLDARLPREMVEMIRENWSSYEVFRPRRNEKLPQMLDRLFKESGYYRINRKGDPWVLDGGIQIKIGADWIIWPTREDYAAGRATVITLPPTQTQGTAPELAKFLSMRGVRVIDFYPRGNLIGPEPIRSTTLERISVETIKPSNYTDFIQTLLGMLGQRYETDLSIPLMKGGSSDASFNYSVTAPLYFSRGGKNFVVAVSGLPDNVISQLEKSKFKVIVRRPHEQPRQFASRLLSEIGVRNEAGLTIQGSNREKPRNIEVTLPGVVFTADGRETLLTPTEVPPILAPLLKKPNLRVIHYIVNNPT